MVASSVVIFYCIFWSFALILSLTCAVLAHGESREASESLRGKYYRSIASLLLIYGISLFFFTKGVLRWMQGIHVENTEFTIFALSTGPIVLLSLGYTVYMFEYVPAIPDSKTTIK